MHQWSSLIAVCGPVYFLVVELIIFHKGICLEQVSSVICRAQLQERSPVADIHYAVLASGLFVKCVSNSHVYTTRGFSLGQQYSPGCVSLSYGANGC